MATTILGQVSVNPRGEWIDGESYKRLDVVNTTNASYMAREDNTGTSLDDENAWMQIGRSGRDGHSIVVLPNGNFGNWDEATGTYVDTGIPAAATVDVANAEISFLEAMTRANINTGEKVNVIFGKIRKWFSDLRGLAFKDKIDYTTDVENAPNIPTDNSQIANGANYQNAAQVENVINTHNTNATSHNDIRTAIENRVEKVAGKGLSTEDYTTAEKQKLAGLESSKFKGEFTSLEELQTAWPTADSGSYSFVDAGVGSNTQKYIWDSSDSKWIISGSTGEETPATIKEKYESNVDTNAFTDTEKAKLSGIEVGAQKNAASVDKSATIAVANWVQQSDETYTAIIYDTDILDNSKVSVMPADTDSFDIYIEAIVFLGTSSAGQFYLKAKNAPSGNMNINYTIGI